MQNVLIFIYMIHDNKNNTDENNGNYNKTINDIKNYNDNK